MSATLKARYAALRIRRNLSARRAPATRPTFRQARAKLIAQAQQATGAERLRLVRRALEITASMRGDWHTREVLQRTAYEYAVNHAGICPRG